MTTAVIQEPAASLSLTEGTVRRNIVSTVAGGFLFSGSQWLITVVLARMGNMATVGQYALGLALCLPVFSFTGLQLRAVQATDCAGTYHYRDYLTLRLAGSALAVAVVLAVTLIMPWQRETILVVMAVACSKAVDSFSNVQYGLLQLRDRLDLVAWAMSIRAICGLTALTTGMLMFHSAAVALAWLTVAWLAVALLYERPLVLRMEGARHTESQPAGFATYKRLVVLCLPLAFVLLALSAASSLPRLMLEHSAGERSLGIFSAVAMMSGAIGLLYSALGQTALPRLARMFSHDRRRFHAAISQMMLFSAFVGLAMLVAAWFWGVRLMTMIYGNQRGVTAELVTGLVCVGMLANTSSLLGAGLTASRRFWAQLLTAVITLAITAAAGAWLIPKWGARGAMYASLAGVCFQISAYGYLCQHAGKSKAVGES